MTAAPPARNFTRSEWRWTGVAALLIVVCALSPFLWAEISSVPAYHYGGTVWLAGDTALLLGTMWEGIQGHWLHHPPYVTASNLGGFFYPQYILLGHLAGWLRVDPVFLFHAGRAVGGIVLLLMLYRFVGRFFEDITSRRLAFLLVATGSGLGWLGYLFGQTLSVDTRHQELYPFFSIVSSLHVTWALAALIALMDGIIPLTDPAAHPSHSRWAALGWIAAAMLLGITQPFGIVLVGVVGVLWLIARWLHDRQIDWGTFLRLVTMTLVSVPFIALQLWTIATNPAYIGWREQVETLSGPVWEYLLGIGLVFPFAVWGVWLALRRRNANDLLLLFWLGCTALLVYTPYYQNRRFELGAWIPVSILAATALGRIPLTSSALRRFAFVGVCTITNLLLLASIFYVINQRLPLLYLTQSEWNAVTYLRAHAAERAVVLASPQTSLFIMSSSALRVVYGHSGETPHAAQALDAVRAFYGGCPAGCEALLAPVQYIFVGPRERELGNPAIPPGYALAFSDGDVSIYGRSP